MDTNKITGVERLHPDTVYVYRFIYKNAQLGMGTLGKIHPLSCCKDLNEILLGQRRGYTAILRNAANELALSGTRPYGMSAYEKLYTCLIIHLHTASGKHRTHIIGHLITSATVQAIEGARIRRRSPMADEKSMELLERFLRFQDANCKKLKEFL